MIAGVKCILVLFLVSYNKEADGCGPRFEILANDISQAADDIIALARLQIAPPPTESTTTSTSTSTST